MKSILKHSLSVALACLTVTAGILPAGVMPALGAGEDPFAGWNKGGWTVRDEDGVPVATAPGEGAVNSMNSSKLADGINTLSFEVRPGKSWGTVDGNLGVQFTCPNGYSYFFEYNTVGNYSQVRRLGDGGYQLVVSGAVNRTLTEGKWYSMKIVCGDDSLSWYLDGTLIHEVKDTMNDPMEGGSFTVQGYMSAPSVRKLTLSHTETGAPSDGPVRVDFEFPKASSVRGFTADGGEVGWRDDRLVWTLGSGRTLTTPALAYTSGDAYSARLDLRNTLYVRMSNKTDAKQLRLSWITAADTKYDTAKSKVFDVKPQSGDTTYLFNISDNKKATGILRGFRFELIDAGGGTCEIEAISFEREKPIYDYAGTLTSCRVEGDKVVIKGTLADKYKGKTVTLYETEVDNYLDKLNANQVVASVKASGKDFTFEIPLKNGKVSRLSSMFLVSVDGVRVTDRFMVENWRDSLPNPYAFTLPDRTVMVTDAEFGAKGDGYTNDTDAIQKAIDTTSAAGGGTVVVPGDDSAYGRRYIVTTIRLKSNTELRVESGAVLWQSPRPADYPYEVVYGHDVSISGINWTHAGLCHNYPMIYAYEAENIRLTGGGTLRSVDTGSECIDSVSGDAIWVGCENRIHLITIGMQGCTNVEISDIAIRRANCYHMMLRNSSRVWIANLDMREATCASGDGIGVSSACTDVEIDRCILYSNDDSITLCPGYNDPRGLVWWHGTPDADNSVRRVTVRSCNLCGGHGLTFIPWGTDNPDLSKQLIEDITCTDCVLAGGSAAIGTWPDNPYHGKAFDNTETDDYSPVQNVTILNNRCRGSVNLECLKVTGLVADCGLRSASDFEYGGFEHRKERKGTWENGLSNWESRLYDDSASVAAAADGDGKNANHFGEMNGHASLYQGLYMSAGTHHLSIDVSILSGEATLFARDRVTGEIVAEKQILAGKSFRTNILTFTLDKGATLDLGVEAKSGTVRIDNASVTTPPAQKKMYFTESFDNGNDSVYLAVNSMEAAQEDGNTYVFAEGGIRTLTAANPYKDVKVDFRMRFRGKLSDIDSNVGVCVCQNGNNYYFLEYNPTLNYRQVRLFKDGTTKVVFMRNGGHVPVGEWADCTVTVQDGRIVWMINGEELIAFEDKSLTSGEVLFNCYNVMCDFDDITISPLGENAASEYEPQPEPEAPTEPPYVPDPEPETEPVTEGPEETAAETGEGTLPGTDAETQPVSKGCGSALTGLAALLTVTAAALWMAWRKKEN
ncbi:MAG: DUF1080 domain-containing protein [Clostridia bacterium]|nr:DUF1080 domain-containing protein [Clostridia bacterium]